MGAGVTDGRCLIGKKISIGVLFDVVTIKIICGDDYEAQVIFDDLIDRSKSGGFSLEIGTGGIIEI